MKKERTADENLNIAMKRIARNLYFKVTNELLYNNIAYSIFPSQKFMFFVGDEDLKVYKNYKPFIHITKDGKWFDIKEFGNPTLEDYLIFDKINKIKPPESTKLVVKNDWMNLGYTFNGKYISTEKGGHVVLTTGELIKYVVMTNNTSYSDMGHTQHVEQKILMAEIPFNNTIITTKLEDLNIFMFKS